MVNAWDEAGTIKVDICASNASQFAPKLDGTMATADEGVRPTLRRWTIDVGGSTDTVTEEILDDLSSEFPRTDDRFMTRSYQHAYLVGGHGEDLVFNRLLHYNMRTGARKMWGKDSYFLGEPILAPRSEDAGEGDGYILNLAYNRSTELTELLIFAADDIEQGPVCKAKLPLRIPSGFHGSWVGA